MSRFLGRGDEEPAYCFLEYRRYISPLIAIPPNCSGYRTFLLHSDHAQYFELAQGFLAGERKASHLAESSLYSMQLPRQDSTSNFNPVCTGTRDTKHTGGIIIDAFDLASFSKAGDSTSYRGNCAAELVNQGYVHLVHVVSRPSLPACRTGLSNLVDPFVTPILMPLLALYFVISAENLTPGVKDRYLDELKFETCITVLMAVVYDLRYSHRIYWCIQRSLLT